MNESDPPKDQSPSPVDYAPGPPGEPKADGCLSLVGGAIIGFVLFLVGGGMAIGAESTAGIIIYLIFATAVAIACVIKPGLRGLAIGIFLGLGAVLLLLAICSGTHF